METTTDRRFKELLELAKGDVLKRLVTVTLMQLDKLANDIENINLSLEDDKKGGAFDRFLKIKSDLPKDVENLNKLMEAFKIEGEFTAKKGTGKFSSESLLGGGS